MVNTNLLKGKMAEKGITQEKLASLLHTSPKTLRSHFSAACFDSNEIYTMIKELDITNIKEIFFADEIA